MIKLSSRTRAFVRLTRLDKPIGWLLLLWPTLWALWFAAGGTPSIKNLAVFVCGVIMMRSAGCVINDFADRRFDGEVERTKARPLPTGEVTSHEALALFAILCLLSFALVLATNRLTVLLSLVAVLLAGLYPFCKRFTYFPQVVLGAAFSWAIPMAFAAETGKVANPAWALFATALIWTVAYDTFYAMVDREDDLKIGIKSTAILFGDMDLAMIALLQATALTGLVIMGRNFDMGLYYYLGLAIAAWFFYRQHQIAKKRDREGCFKAFLHNNRVGAVIFLGIFLDYRLPGPF